MKLRLAVFAVLCIGLVCCISSTSSQVYAQGKITVLNPMGTPPPIQVKPMAPRLATLDGKTIYIVNTGFVNTDKLMAEIMAWFKENHPTTKLVLKSAGMDSIPQNLLTEIGQQADGVLVGLGH
jgi:hypothetical protein